MKPPYPPLRVNGEPGPLPRKAALLSACPRHVQKFLPNRFGDGDLGHVCPVSNKRLSGGDELRRSQIRLIQSR